MPDGRRIPPRTTLRRRHALLVEVIGGNAKHIVAAAVKGACEGDRRAGAWLFERAYGKPEQGVEVETPGSLGDIAAMTPEERKALRARLMREHPELRELVPKDELRRGI